MAPRPARRVQVRVAAAAVALVAIGAPFVGAAAQASAQPLAQAHGGGVAFGPLGPLGVGMPASATDAATPALDGRAIATLAWAQLGRGLDGPNTLTGGDFGGSSRLPGAWCAAFAGWVWAAAGSEPGGAGASGAGAGSAGASGAGSSGAGAVAPISTVGLNGWAGSFRDYGVAEHTFHTGAPRVGDAALFSPSEAVAEASALGTLTDSHLLEHVGIVVAVSTTTVTIVNGDWGNGAGGAQLVRMSTYPLASSDAPDYAQPMRQYIAGYVDPVAAPRG